MEAIHGIEFSRFDKTIYNTNKNFFRVTFTCISAYTNITSGSQSTNFQISQSLIFLFVGKSFPWIFKTVEKQLKSRERSNCNKTSHMWML